MTSECLDECDDLILWFSEGTYVYQAMELKMKYKPLTPLQQEKYDHRNDGIGRKDSSKRKPSFRKSKERPAPNPRIADKVRKDVHVTDSIDLPDLPEPMARTHASEPEAESQPKPGFEALPIFPQPFPVLPFRCPESWCCRCKWCSCSWICFRRFTDDR